MADLTQAVIDATTPYKGFTYYATGNQYYDPAQTAKYINDMNTKFNLNLTPEEIKKGIDTFAAWHRNQFGFPVSQVSNQQTWNNQNGIGNFTNLSDPLAIARESVANVLRTRGLPESTIQSNFLTPLQDQSTASTAKYQDLADNLAAAQKTAWESVNPSIGDMGWGSLIGDLLSNPVVLGLGGAALGLSGVLSGLGDVGTVAGLGSSAGESAALGSLGSGLTGVDLAGAGLAGTTPAMAGALGSGLSGTTLASLGLDAGALGGAAAGAGGLSSLASTGGGMSDWTDFLGDWTNWGDSAGATNTAANSGWDFGPGSDSFLGGGLDPVSGLNLAQSSIPSGWDFGPLSDSLLNGGIDPVSGMTLDQMKPGLLDAIKNYITNNPGSTLKTAAQALGVGGTGAASTGKTSTGIGWLDSLLGGGLSGQTVGAGLSALLGYKASQDQTKALTDQADKYAAMGAPYRQRLADLYANPDSFLQSDTVRKPVQQGTDMLMRSLSTQGNPWGSGNALQQGQNYATDRLAGLLGQEKDRLAGYGGLSSYNQAAPQAATQAIGSSSNAWQALGSGAANIFNPPETQAQTLANWANWAKLMKGVL